MLRSKFNGGPLVGIILAKERLTAIAAAHTHARGQDTLEVYLTLAVLS